MISKEISFNIRNEHDSWEIKAKYNYNVFTSVAVMDKGQTALLPLRRNGATDFYHP
jgi:hypothetical protein